MCKFDVRDVFTPGVGVGRTVDPEVCFDFLVYALSLSISLWVVGCGQFRFDAKFSTQFLEYFGGKLSSSIGNHYFRKAKSSEDRVVVELSSSDCINLFGAGHENYCFGDIMVYHNE